jgi:hypothetical protein
MDDQIDNRKRVLPRLATAATAQHLNAAQKEIDRVCIQEDSEKEHQETLFTLPL